MQGFFSRYSSLPYSSATHSSFSFSFLIQHRIADYYSFIDGFLNHFVKVACLVNLSSSYST